MEQELMTIPYDEYLELKRDQEFLRCLESCGVDNWEWYDDAREQFNKDT